MGQERIRKTLRRLRRERRAAPSPTPPEPPVEVDDDSPSGYEAIDQAPRTTSAAQRRDIRKLLRGSLFSGLQPHPPAEQYPVSAVMGFGLDLAEAMLLAGANSRDTEVAVVAVTATWELAPLELEITAAAVRLQYSPDGEAPITEMRIVRGIGDDLTALSRLYRLVDAVVAGRLDLTAAGEQLAEISRRGPRWPVPAQVAAMGVLGAMLSLLSGGDARSAIVAFVLVSLAVAFGRLAARTTLAPFFVVALQSALGMALGTTAIAADLLGPAQAATAVAPLIVLLLPHPAIVAWAQDAITGFRDPANARGLSVVLVILGVLLGVPAGLVVTTWFSLEVDPSEIHLVSPGLGWVLVVSAVAAWANAVAQGAAARTFGIILLAALASALVLQGMTAAGFGTLVATFVAATVLGIIGTVFAAWLRTAVMVLVVPAFCGALLPSLAVASSLLNLVAGTTGAAFDVAVALATTLAIGAGLVLGTQLVTPLVRTVVSRTRTRPVSRG